jgi:hypothetical protein
VFSESEVRLHLARSGASKLEARPAIPGSHESPLWSEKQWAELWNMSNLPLGKLPTVSGDTI